MYLEISFHALRLRILVLGSRYPSKARIKRSPKSNSASPLRIFNLVRSASRNAAAGFSISGRVPSPLKGIPRILWNILDIHKFHRQEVPRIIPRPQVRILPGVPFCSHCVRVRTNLATGPKNLWDSSNTEVTRPSSSVTPLGGLQ